MAFATVDQVAVRAGRDLTAPEQEMATALLDAAAGLIADAVGQDDAWITGLDPVPSILSTVSVEAVWRVLTNPSGAIVTMEQLGAYQHSETWGSPRVGAAQLGLALTKTEERQVRRAVNGRLTATTLESPYSDDTTTNLDFAQGAL